ncbi:MAG: glycine--tRNA ligase, partial [Armatimonadota bacterium]|nr:glycine--tRNA ligase [Armatimonadota bacterium]
MDTIVSLCKRRGFIFQNSEIYGGIGSTWDYGPLGVEFKNNVKRAWWKAVVQTRDDVVGLDAAILMHPRVWEASGHVQGFSDPLVDCKECKQRFRADQVYEVYAVAPDGKETYLGGAVSQDQEEALEQVKNRTPGKVKDLEKKGHTWAVRQPMTDGYVAPKVCPFCGGELTEARQFNLMFKTFMGPVEEDAAVTYLRPETAQGIFANFKNVQMSTRKKIPFGIAQVGKSFRNEITPGNFTFRTREFEQMEIEYFVKPGTDEEWHKKWVEDRWNWYIGLGMTPEKLRLRPHGENELAFYSKATSDIEYLFPFGWSELEGIANRGDYDLKRHMEYSGKDLSYFDDATNEEYVPYVIEPSGGCDRASLAFLIDAYYEEEVKNEKRVVLKLHKDLAPIKAAVFPLKRNEPRIVEVAHNLAADLRKTIPSQYDDTGSIGKLYRRQDEIGTLWGITVDFQTLEDQTVTIRDRDTMEQIRVPVEGVKKMLVEKLES